VGGDWTSSLEEEFRQYHDLIWLNVPESYRGITVKVLGMFTALHEQLVDGGYDYLVKTDDDSYLRLAAMEQSATAVATSKINQRYNDESDTASSDYLYWGRPCRAGDPVNRKPTHKWYVSPQTFNGTEYPPYAQGSGYVLSQSLMQCIVQSNQMGSTRRRKTTTNVDAHVEPIRAVLPIEDVMTGILVDRCGGTCLKDRRFYIPSDAKNTKIADNKRLFVVHGIKTADLMFQHHVQTCCYNDNNNNDPLSCQDFACPSSLDAR
jgi:hypothetical protein